MSDSYMDGFLAGGSTVTGSVDLLSLLTSNSSAHVPSPTVNSGTETLSDEKETRMMQSIEEIFLLDEEPEKEDEEMNGEEEDEEEVVDLEDQERRTERLKGIMPTLAQLWWAGSEMFDVATEKLADGSRNCECKLSSGNLEVYGCVLQHRHPSTPICFLSIFLNHCGGKTDVT